MHSLLNVIQVIALVFTPIAATYVWWTSLRTPLSDLAQWRKVIFFSALSAVTGNLVVFWSWVIYLASHRSQTDTWKVWDKMSDLGLCLILFGILASFFGKGRNRALLATAGVLSILSWIPVGVL